MLLIYTQKITPRIVYTFKHILTNVLGIPIKFTSKIEEFIAHEGMKFSYGKQALGNEFFVQNVEILLEQGLTEVEIKVQTWDDVPCFFAVQEASEIPFDIFAATFYLLSRYEEYMPHVKDKEGRFPATESLAYEGNFLDRPVVDIWAYKFKKILQKSFPDIEPGSRQFGTMTIINVHHVFNFKNKGFIRTVLGTFIDVFQLQFWRIIDRIEVLLNIKKDPFDVFDELIGFIKKYRVKMIFMFQLSDFTIYDRNISPNRINYRTTIKYVADYAKIGLLLGYYAVNEIKILKLEKRRLENIVHRSVESVMNSKFNLVLPDSYNNLTELEIKNDYSMGYPGTMGFRAGTCTPFLFYDINVEITTPLMVHPYIFNSGTLENANKEQMKDNLAAILEEVKSVDGAFKAVFSNPVFSEYSDSSFFYSVLKQIHEIE